MKQLYFILICFGIGNLAFAQNKQNLNAHSFKLSTEYLSNYVYNGRGDSITTPYFSTNLEYKNGGLTLNGIPYLLLENGSQRLDFFELDGSYEKEFTDKFVGTFYASKYFSSNQRNAVNSDITGLLGLSSSYDFSIFNITTDLGLMFSTKSDQYVNIALDKDFKHEFNAGVLSFNPAIDFNFSSTNFYESAVTRNAQRRNKKNINLPSTPIINTTSVVNPGFRFMDYELSLPISYEKDQISIYVTPTYFVPFNSVKTISQISTNGITTSSVSTPYSELNLHNGFFFQIGLSYTFK